MSEASLMLQKTALIFFSRSRFLFSHLFIYFFVLLLFFFPSTKVRLFLANSKLSLIPVVLLFYAYMYIIFFAFFIFVIYFKLVFHHALIKNCFTHKTFFISNALGVFFIFLISYPLLNSFFHVFLFATPSFNSAILQLRLKVFLLNFDAEIEQEKLEIKKPKDMQLKSLGSK